MTVCLLLSTEEIICNPLNPSFSTSCQAIRAIPTNVLNEGRELPADRDLRGLFQSQQRADKYTVFVPNNKAWERLDLPFELDLNGDLTSEQVTFLRYVIFYHIIGNNQVISFDDLKCNQKHRMLNGIDTQTRCSTNRNNNVISKYQIGSSNSAFGNNDDDNEDSDIVVLGKKAPKIFKSKLASNGIVHAVTNVILPDFDNLVTDTGVPSDVPSLAPSK